MKNKLLLLFIVVSCSYDASAFETGRYFSRIDEQNNLVQMAYRSYTKPDEKNPNRTITVQLIGMSHIAIAQFYNDVENLIKNKVVLYELCGATLEKHKARAEKFNSLPSPHKERHFKYFEESLPPDSLGQVSQTCMSYAGCKELIHADAKENPHKAKPLQPNTDADWQALTEEHYDWVCEHGSQAELAKFIDKKILKSMKHYNIPCDEMTLDDNLSLLLQKQEEDRTKPSRNAMSDEIRRREEIDQRDIDGIRHHKNDYFGGDSTECSRQRFIMVERNEFIFSALKAAWCRSEIPDQIAVPYGAAHLPFVEEFLLSQGFKPLAGSDGWLTVAELVPLPPKIQEKLAQPWKSPDLLSAPVQVFSEKELKKNFSNELVRRTFRSIDGFLRIHVIGTIDAEPQQSASDSSFLSNLLSGHWHRTFNAWKEEIYLEAARKRFLNNKFGLYPHYIAETGQVELRSIPEAQASRLHIVYRADDLLGLQIELMKIGFILEESAPCPGPVPEEREVRLLNWINWDG